MNNPDAKKWIKLTFKIQQGNILMLYGDGFGNKVENYDQYRIVSRRNFSPFQIPYEIDFHIRNALNASPRDRLTRIGFGPIPLAVFLELKDILSWPFSLWADSELLSRVFFSELFKDIIEPGQVQIIILLPDKTQAKLKLPLNIRFSGEDSLTMMDVIRSKDWYFKDPVVEKYGLSQKAGSLPSIYEDADILVLQYPEAAIFYSEFDKADKSSLRLIIILHPFPRMILKLEQLERLRVPCLFIGYRRLDFALEFLKDFIYCIIHDFSLHEATYYAKNKPNASGIDAILFASPMSNQNLRLTMALESFKAEVNTYAKKIRPGNFDSFLDKFDDQTSSDLKSTISKVIPDDLGMNEFFKRASSLDIHFQGESTGLIPLAHEEKQFFENQTNFDLVKSRLESIVNDPQFFQILRDKQERRVDITMDEFNSSLVYVPVFKNNSLKAGNHYRLNVTIGQISENSLITGFIPPIDPLLPDPEGAKGHELDIVVFPKDFKLLSDACQQVYLPLLGGTDRISFNLIAPEPSKKAELRIAIFHKNHLLQAFILMAEIEKEILYSTESMLTVSLDLSTSAKFTNLGSLSPRTLYIGMNSNGDKSHSLFLKKDAVTNEIDGLPDGLLEEAQNGFRVLLNEAYYDANGESKFSPSAMPGGNLSTDFYDQARKFARFGGAYFRNIFNGVSEEARNKLSEIRELKDKEIQIGRHNLNYSFPWSILYDYNLPPDIHGGPDYPVCIGKKFDEGKYDSFKCGHGFGCPHNPDILTFCIEGFWGIRHKIEQIFSNSNLADFNNTIPVDDHSKIFYSYNFRDTYSNALSLKMQEFTPKVITIEPSTSLMDLLWNLESRPTTLIVFGHLETKPIDQEPIGARIITFPKADWTLGTGIPPDKWIYPDLLFNYYMNFKKWNDQPLPIVFLINCSSAALTVKSLNSIVKGFHTAGASAIIGTECDITSGLGARFVEEVLGSIYKNGMELGEAIQLFNKNLFASGIPLAFVFTCYGNTNLKISSP
jgi:hypothetical protein